MRSRIVTLMPASTRDSEVGIVELWRRYDQLCHVVRRAEGVFSKLELPRTRSPTRRELLVVLEQAGAIAVSLADLLDGLDGEWVSSADELYAFFAENHAPGAETGCESAPARLPWARDGVLARLQSFYFFHVELNNLFYEQRIPTTFVWQENLGLWQTFVYCGGITAQGGLLSRLASLAWRPELLKRAAARERESKELLSGRVTSFHCEQAFGVITLDDGRDVKFDAANCTMVPQQGDVVRLRIGPASRGGGIKALHVEPPTAPGPPLPRATDWRPWNNSDIAALRSIAANAESLATADDDVVLEHDRE
jgi:cold shock CspA family protein